MPFVRRDGCRIHWQETGAGSPVLLIMGAVYSSRLWYPTVPALRERHRVISFDNRGTGRSGATRTASIADMTGDALAVLDAAGVDSAHVYGVSLGGVIAQELAIRAPQRARSLILGCTCILTVDKPRAPTSYNRRLRWTPRRVRVASTTYGPACPPENAATNQKVLLGDVARRRALVAQQDALRAYRADRSLVAALAMPALVIHGTADPIVPAAWGRELAETLPDSRFITYQGCGHNYLAEMGSTPNDDVLAFLQDVESRSFDEGRSA